MSQCVDRLKPPALAPSSLVGVVAPASPVRQEFVERGLAELARLGFRTRTGRSLELRTRYTAGDATARAKDLLDLWQDPEVAAIFCARGGYGCLELLDHLDPQLFRARPKILLGSSDVTALLAFLTAKAGLVCFHGPMVAQQIAKGPTAYDSASLMRVLTTVGAGGRIPAPGARELHPGSAEGILLGGCLSLVTALVGTPYLPGFEDAIVFLEDEAVKPYQIDRMLTQLRLAGCFDGVRGLVFGEMPGCHQHPDQGYRLEELLKELTGYLGVPVLTGFPSGHTVSPAQTLPFGSRARIDSEGLHLLEGAVT